MSYEAALAEYLEQATEDAEWKKLFRHSADQVLEELSSDERARLLEYMGRFSVPSAAFVAKELAAVSAVDLFTGREERSSDNLVRFHRNFILTQAGEEEGKQAADAPKAVMAAALRRQQGTVRVHRERVTESINATMEAFDESDRAKVRDPVCGLARCCSRVHYPHLDVAERRPQAGENCLEPSVADGRPPVTSGSGGSFSTWNERLYTSVRPSWMRTTNWRQPSQLSYIPAPFTNCVRVCGAFVGKPLKSEFSTNCFH